MKPAEILAVLRTTAKLLGIVVRERLRRNFRKWNKGGKGKDHE